jgi:ABC-type bacteriocin/lantibiotic exporter with double-glycine peptidase domain
MSKQLRGEVKMVSAPFNAAEASTVVNTLAVIFFAFSGIALMLSGPSKYAKRSLILGVLLACMAGIAGAIFA